MRLLACMLLCAAALTAQTAPVAKPAGTGIKKIVFATAAGAAAGVLLGLHGPSFAALPPSERRAHELRSGLVYGATGGVLAGALTARFATGESAPSHSFWWDKWNTPLLAGMVAAHGLDFASTRYFRDRGKNEWLLTNALVDKRAAFTATEISAAAAGIGLSYLFHRAGHHRLERWAAAGYIAVGAVSAAANYRYPATGHALF